MPDPHTDTLPLIQTLWIGHRLTTVERLCLRSFLAQGHTVRLYAYAALDGVPDGVEVADAETVLPARHILDTDLRSRGGVPLAVVSDWFRCVLLAERGGFWVDTDVVCLRPFAFQDDLVFGREDHKAVGTAVMGFPAGHPVMRALAASAERPWTSPPWDDVKTRRWRRRRRLRFLGRPAAFRRSLPWGFAAGPVALTRALTHYGLLHRALPASAFYPIHYARFVDLVRHDDPPSLEELRRTSHAVHLWHDLWELHGVGEDETRAPGCLLEQLKEAYL